VPEKAPVVYILHGEDEYGIAQTLVELESRLGDPANAALNTTRFDSGTFQPDQLLSVAGVMPFLARRRLVILSSVLGRLNQKPDQEKFLRQLERLPPTTALILTENSLLTSDRDREQDRIHWLERWAGEHVGFAWVRAFSLPKGADWVRRLQEYAEKAGGKLSQEAAVMLYDLLDGDLRLADQEIQKLLAYVNYARPVEADDVEALTADVGQGDIFAMVDALGNRDGRKAMGMLRRLLEYQDYFAIFGMVTRQFRMLIQAREILDNGGGREEVLHGLGLGRRYFIADRMIGQVRHFSPEDLKAIYRRLLDIDEAVKTSRMPGDLALEMLTTALTTVPTEF
jgi:DNA polymerase III subunit delta